GLNWFLDIRGGAVALCVSGGLLVITSPHKVELTPDWRAAMKIAGMRSENERLRNQTDYFHVRWCAYGA
ncbi:MAG TPA: hypothetical protein VIW93_00955, partial [Candidatus Acidoferrum sp.]